MAPFPHFVRPQPSRNPVVQAQIALPGLDQKTKQLANGYEMPAVAHA